MTEFPISQIRVHQVLSLPPIAKTAQWLSSLLLPVISAASIRNPPPIELRAMGRWGGQCRSVDVDPDRRICMSHLALHWTHQSMVVLYLHEACHRMLGWAPGDDEHDAAFAALLHCLLSRCDRASVTDGAVLSVGLYDLANTPWMLVDEPDAGVGRSMAWAVSTSNELSQSDLSAEELAVEIRRRYNVWLDDLEEEPARIERVRTQAAQQEKTRRLVVQGLHEKVSSKNIAISCLSLLVLALLVLLFTGHP